MQYSAICSELVLYQSLLNKHYVTNEIRLVNSNQIAILVVQWQMEDCVCQNKMWSLLQTVQIKWYYSHQFNLYRVVIFYVIGLGSSLKAHYCWNYYTVSTIHTLNNYLGWLGLCFNHCW